LFAATSYTIRQFEYGWQIALVGVDEMKQSHRLYRIIEWYTAKKVSGFLTALILGVTKEKI
jgi:hypothetical protein